MQATVDTSALKEKIVPLIEKYPRFFMLAANFLGRESVWGYIQINRGGKGGKEVSWAEHYSHQ